MRQVIVSAPGRANIIGEHVDYNQGWIIPFAVDRYTKVTLTPSHDKMHRIISPSFGEDVFPVGDMTPSRAWSDYVKGVIQVLQQHTAMRFPPLSFTVESDVPVGAGLSSSAAIEVATLIAIEAFFELPLNNEQRYLLAQQAENEFVGVRCGIMDQFISVMGRKDYAVCLDTQSMQYEYLPIRMDEYQWWILNTNVKHSLGSGEYNIRRAQCEQAVRALRRSGFRDIQMNDLDRDILGELLFKRARHVVSEMTRTLQCKEALIDREWIRVGQLLYETHESLQNDYEVSCDELDYVVMFLRNRGVCGARMMGGGFGGSVITLIQAGHDEGILPALSKDYHQHFGIELEAWPVSPSQGAKVIVEGGERS